jgi:hypothetical protein
MKDLLFTTFDIARMFDIKIDRIKDWITRGYIVPSIQRAKGQGTKSLFNEDDIVTILLFMNLLEITNRENAGEIAKRFRSGKLWTRGSYTKEKGAVAIVVYPTKVTIAAWALIIEYRKKNVSVKNA